MRSAPVTAFAILAVACATSAAASASESWEAVCAQPPVMPAIEEVLPPVPQAGQWRGKGFGNKRKSNDVSIKECGRRIEGLIGVRLKGNVPHMVALELDEDDGRYKASFTYTEGGAAAVVTWNLEAESESRITGRMTIMGRGDQVEADLLEAAPSPEMTACECEAVQNRRADLDKMRTELEEPSAPTPTAWGFTTDPDTCAIEETTPDRGLPTQASFEVLMNADWQGELVHHERCCTVLRAAGDGTRPATYSDWVRASADEYASDEVTAVTAQLEAIDSWLENRCQ